MHDPKRRMRMIAELIGHMADMDGEDLGSAMQPPVDEMEAPVEGEEEVAIDGGGGEKGPMEALLAEKEDGGGGNPKMAKASDDDEEEEMSDEDLEALAAM